MRQGSLRKSIGEIKKTLEQGLDIHLLQIEDQGHLHQGHKPAKEGKMHLKTVSYTHLRAHET